VSKLDQLRTLALWPSSLVVAPSGEFGLARTAAGPRLAILVGRIPAGFEGECSEQDGLILLLGPANPHNARALREQFDWLRPAALGMRTSAGLGDRLGLATPGHVRALRAAGGGIAPVFAQQSMREMTRTGRTPQEVMDDALWGVFQEGWRAGFGADADHLKTAADVDACLAAGFTLFTLDPGEYVNNAADTDLSAQLAAAVGQLPPEVQPAASGLQTRAFDIEGLGIAFDEPTLWRAAAKYGRAVAHVAALDRHLRRAPGGRYCEVEISVDETETPTTLAEHIYLVSELRRLGVQWASLAPRYVGRFEKGVDYISPDGRTGEITAFETDLAVHAAIARQFGPYKLSLHSGSDKFSIYPAAMRETRGLVHLKTAGTSYLEALRAVASLAPALFRDIYAFAREHYESDRASYHVSARLSRAPLPQDTADAGLPELLNQFDAREILHVTYGSVLTERDSGGRRRLAEPLLSFLRTNPEVYSANLERHFLRHLQPFAPLVAPVHNFPRG
jgi:hypothetical protein